MAKKSTYSFTCGEHIHVEFDSQGYVVDAKGFGLLVWTTDLYIDKSIIGKHVDELAELLSKNSSSPNVFNNFETGVHIPMLKIMLHEN